MKYALIPAMVLMFGISFSVHPEPDAPEADTALELEEARKAMQEAARHYAELAAQHADRAIRDIRIHRVVAPRARLGVVLEPDVGQRRGALVREVVEGGPAAAAGLRAGDLLLAIGEASLQADGPLPGDHPAWRVRAAIADAGPGDEVVVRYLRDGSERSVSVVLGEAEPFFGFRMDEFGERMNERMRMIAPPGETWLRHRGGSRFAGVEMVRLSAGLGRYFGTESGLLVVRAPGDNPLDLRDGDVILNIDGRAPESPVHAMRILRSYAPGESFRIDIMRDHQRRSLEVTIPANGG